MFVDIQETIQSCASALHGAIEGMKLIDRSGVNKSTEVIDLNKNTLTRLAELREIYDSFKDSERIEDSLYIDCRLNELTGCIIRAAKPAIALKKDFLVLRNNIIAKQKKSPRPGGKKELINAPRTKR